MVVVHRRYTCCVISLFSHDTSAPNTQSSIIALYYTYKQEHIVHVDWTARHIYGVFDPQGIDATVEQVEHRQCVMLGEEDLSFK